MYRNLNPGCGTSIFEFMPQIARLFNALRLLCQPDQATIDWVASLNTQFADAVSCNSLLKFAQVSAQATTIAKELGKKIANFELDPQSTITKLTDVLEYAKEIDDKSQTWWQNRESR